MKKKLIVLVTFLFVLASVLGILAACEDAKYTVTFKNGDEVVKTVEVKQGDALVAGDIPADPTAPAGHRFDGWYIGTTKVEAGYKPTADVTAEAKFVETVATVKFVVGTTTVKTVTVDVGAVIPQNQLPSEPTAEEAGLDPEIYTSFLGWFDAEGNQFVETAAITGSVTYTAKFNKVAVWTVRFIDGDKVVLTIEVPQTNGKLKEVPTQTVASGRIAQGWYTADAETIAVEGMEITSDMDFYAMSVGQSDYAGAWLDTEAHKMIIFTEDNKVIIDGQSYGRFYEEGQVTVGAGSGFSRKEWTLSIVGSKLKVEYGGYDEYEDWETYSYTLIKGAEVDYAGTYRNGQYIITIMNGGAISTLFAGNQGGGIYRYAVMVEDGEGYKIQYYANSSITQLTEIAVTLDNGVLVVEGASSDSYNGWYLKASACVTYSYYVSGVGYYKLFVYTTESGTVYVYSTPEDIHFATVEGEVEDEAIITIKVAGQDDIRVKISGTSLVFASEEAGTYTGEAGNLVLDGFGNATIEGKSFKYEMFNGMVVASDYSVAYVLNSSEKTYTLVESDGYKGTYIYQQESWAKYTVILDGFGNFQHIYNTGTPVVGTYTISGTTMTVANAQYSYNGAWTIAADGNVLILANGTTNSGFTYVKEGYVLPEPSEEFNGTWESGSDTVIITLAAKTINYKGQTVTFTANFDGTVLSFSTKDTNCKMSHNCSFTATLSEGTLKIVHERATQWDDIYEEWETTTITETFTKKEGGEESGDALKGTWVFGDWSFYFDGEGHVTIKGTTVDYTFDGTNVSFRYNWEDWTGTLSADGNTLTLSDEYGDEFGYNHPCTRA